MFPKTPPSFNGLDHYVEYLNGLLGTDPSLSQDEKEIVRLLLGGLSALINDPVKGLNADVLTIDKRFEAIEKRLIEIESRPS